MPCFYMETIIMNISQPFLKNLIRFDGLNAKTTSWLLKITIGLLEGMAYVIGEDFLISHAGITRDWKDIYLPKVDDIKPSSMAVTINNLWSKEKKSYSLFTN